MQPVFRLGPDEAMQEGTNMMTQAERDVFEARNDPDSKTDQPATVTPDTKTQGAAPEVPQTDTGSGDPQSTTTTPAAEARPESDSEPKREDKDAIQKRIDKAVWKQKEAERQAEYWRQQALQAPKPESKPAAEGKPTADQFQTYEDFQEAIVDWKLAQHANQQRMEREKAQEQDRAVRRKQIFEEGSKRRADFASKVSNPDLRITADMAGVIDQSEQAVDVLYYLAEHLDVCAGIAQLSPILQARELGKIEVKVEQERNKPQPKTTTSAPPPITPVKSSASSIEEEKDEDKLPMNELYKRLIAKYGRRVTVGAR